MTEGQCHCSAVIWRHSGRIDHATACNRTICRRTGAIRGHGREGVDVTMPAPAEGLMRYIQGDRSLAMLICATCGNLAACRGVAPGPDGRRRMAVNLRLADPATVAAIPVKRFDGFDSW